MKKYLLQCPAFYRQLISGHERVLKCLPCPRHSGIPCLGFLCLSDPRSMTGQALSYLHFSNPTSEHMAEYKTGAFLEHRDSRPCSLDLKTGSDRSCVTLGKSCASTLFLGLNFLGIRGEQGLCHLASSHSFSFTSSSLPSGLLQIFKALAIGASGSLHVLFPPPGRVSFLL